MSDQQTSGQDAPTTVTPPPEDAPKTNKAVGVIVTRSGKTINVSPSTKVDSNYWTPDRIQQFWTAEEVRRAKELEHQANLRREAERAERARLEAEQKAALEKKLQPRKLAAQMPPEEVTRLLRHALRQATLDRGMESPDKHSYVFEFPPQSGQPESLAAEQVARNKALREAWLEASLVSIQESPKGNTYTFAFPTNVLARLGLFKEGSRQ